MAKLAIRVTSDRSKREHVITGDSEIGIEFVTGNKIQKQIHLQRYTDGYCYIRIFGSKGIAGECEEVIHLGYN